MSIRKGNYGKSGYTIGKVDSVTSETVVLISPTGKSNVVSRDATTKISFSEYTDLAATQGPAGPVGNLQLTDGSAKKPVTKPVVTKSATKPGSDKKTVALAVYAELTTVNGTPPGRQAFSTVMADRVGLSAKGSSTYFYNIKNGKWA